MPSYRCSVCSTNWPIDNEYLTCPQCEAKTSKFSNIKSISDDEAKSLKLHAEFERFYEKWDLEHPPERLVSSGTEVV